MREKLLKLKDEKYKEFNSKLLPNIDNVLGVRVPDLRKLAKELAKTENWQDYKDDLYYEEIMIQGLLIGYVKLEPEKQVRIYSKCPSYFYILLSLKQKTSTQHHLISHH